MNYKNLLNTLSHKGLSNLARHNFPKRRNSGMPIVALVAGLAIGAVLSVLFAPQKGAETRSRIADDAHDLSDSMSRKFKDAKRSLLHAEEEAIEMKDQAVQEVKKKVNKVADKLTDSVEDSQA